MSLKAEKGMVKKAWELVDKEYPTAPIEIRQWIVRGYMFYYKINIASKKHKSKT